MHYVMVDSEGTVVSVHTINDRASKRVPDSAVEVSRAEFHHVAASMGQDTWSIVNGSLVQKPREVPVRDKRKGAYPDLGEQLDAILKGMRQLYAANQIKPIQEMQDLLDQVETVKKRFPKGK